MFFKEWYKKTKNKNIILELFKHPEFISYSHCDYIYQITDINVLKLVDSHLTNENLCQALLEQSDTYSLSYDSTIYILDRLKKFNDISPYTYQEILDECLQLF